MRSAVQEIDSRVIPDLKWPNDLLIACKKFCGLLTEMNAEATRVRHIVVGIGINVNHGQFPDEIQKTATSLAIETGRTMVSGRPVRRFVKIARSRISELVGESRRLTVTIFCAGSKSRYLDGAGKAGTN